MPLLNGKGIAQGAALNFQMPDIPKPKKKIGALAFMIGLILLVLSALAASVALAVFLIRLIFWF